MENIKNFNRKNLNLIIVIGIIAAGMIILSMSGCVGPKTPGNETTTPTPTNETPSGTPPTGQVNENPKETPAETSDIVMPGATVEVNYVGKFEDGTIFDQSEPGSPLKFTVGAGQMIPGFDAAVAGMKVGETKNVKLSPEKAYGNYDPNKIQRIPRIEIDSRVIPLPVDTFKQVTGKDPVLNETYSVQQLPWPIKVVGINSTTVNVRHEPVSNTVINAGFGEVTTVTFNETSLILTHNPAVGAKINTQSGVFTVIGVNDTTISVDTNSPLAGKTLNFEITLVKIMDECDSMGITKSDKPVVNVFVMSYCPYGTQIEKGIIPVQQLLGSKADININFVHYLMHGQKEGDENTAQYCIQKEQKDKYWQYLTCFLDKADSAGCQDKAGIDKTRLQACIASADSEFNISSDMAAGSQYPRYQVNEEMAKKYGIQGSPGLVINGKMISSGRDSESLKKAICCAFNKKPDECGKTLSAAQPAPGFGFSGTGSGADASCGG